MLYSIKMYITIKIILFINYSANKSFLNVSELYILDINPSPFETVIVAEAALPIPIFKLPDIFICPLSYKLPE